MKNFTNQEIISLIDLTSLNLDDTPKTIENLCNKANSLTTPVAAICIYPKFIKQAKEILNKPVSIATVVNFPNGSVNLASTLKEVEFTINSGVNEIDLVMPYSEITYGNYSIVESFIKEVKKNSSNKILKVIIESGLLNKEQLIKDASKIAINAGANFIKTSTGKVNVNATVEAAKYMIEEIKNSGANCGFKAAGGIKTKLEAIEYLEIANKIMGEDFIKKETFRFGASSLLDNLLGKTTESSY